MVDQLDTEQRAGRLQPLGHRPIFGRRRWMAARMIVGDDYGCGTDPDSVAKHLTWMHHARLQTADAHEPVSQHVVAGIQEQCVELLARTAAQQAVEVAGRVAWRFDGLSDPQARAPQAASELEGGRQPRRASWPEPRQLFELGCLELQQRRQAADREQDPGSFLGDRASRPATAENEGEQLDLGQGIGAAATQAFPQVGPRIG